MAFLETPRFPSDVLIGSTGGPGFAVDVVRTRNGAEYRNITNPYEVRRYDVSHLMRDEQLVAEVVDFYRAVSGQLVGFRLKDWADYKSCPTGTAPTALDQPIGTGDGATTQYQLTKTYTKGAVSSARRILKPIDETVLVAVAGHPVVYTVDTTTGVVTLAGNAPATIVAITKGAQTVITFSAPHPFVTDGSVYVAGCLGMTEINGARYPIIADDALTITLALDSSAFTDYTAAGTAVDLAQAGEAITAGYEYDVPVRFDSDDLAALSWVEGDILGLSSIPLVELLNP